MVNDDGWPTRVGQSTAFAEGPEKVGYRICPIAKDYSVAAATPTDRCADGG
jgi:hypothetical protein